jgi:hypothetical protein
LVLDSLAQAPVGKFVRWYVSGTGGLDSSQVAGDGSVTVIWQAPNFAGTYTLTGVRSTTTPLNTVADSAGRIVIRHTLVVKNDVAAPQTSTVVVAATTLAQGATTTITVTLKDQFGNPVKNGTPADFTLTASGVGGGGTISAATCNTNGFCTATYTAPAAAGATTISAKIGTTEILFSPITLTIN